ncbi:chorismate mutase [Streptohalobacillus salinus]|uniref:chorismate mutase n=1 Tax=Streptohalobacillus salinus TaxID=621096 RepID=A0A2V3WF20_9BACI|nr:chorismate mutase [Streptohalobacillus salinus]PXW91728.1 chorismate mutase [Streptohalobacillus salinus]
MIRGIRGATTVEANDAKIIHSQTEALVKTMIEKNKIEPEDVAHVIVSVTDDIDQAFPARPIRELPGWQFVPVMCTKEMSVPGGLPYCIRVMMTVNTSKEQQAIKHIYQHDARQLRPDLLDE